MRGPDGKTSSEVILVVGNVRDWVRHGRTLPDDPGWRYRDFNELDAACLDGLRPNIVLSPLLGRGFDALDIAQRLDALGYQGRFRVLTPRLPRPTVILEELRALAPQLDIDLFQVTNPITLKIV